MTKTAEIAPQFFTLSLINKAMIRPLLILLALCLSAQAQFQFQKDDHVVLLGNTVVERAQKYGYVETALSLAAGENNITFRNLGWSGDTVYCDARSYFGPPQEGFDRLKANLTEEKPNVMVICYGAVASFEGEAGLENFTKGYNRLLDMISETAKPRAIILVSPPPTETHPAPMPDMSAQNQRLSVYRDAIKKIAEERNHHFADLFKTMGEGNAKGQYTDNGVHYTEEGYAHLAPKLVEAIGLKAPQLQSKPADQLRQMIVAKNLLFFQQWRPANETYLRLFRKHEQGQNAKELELFGPLIESRETEITALKRAALNSNS